MEENISSPEDLESDFVDETSEDGEYDGEAPGQPEVPSRLSFTRSCSQYSSSELEDGSSTANRTKGRRRRKRRKRGPGRSGMVSCEKEEVIEAALRAGDKDRLSQLAVSEGGLLSDEVSIISLSVEM